MRADAAVLMPDTCTILSRTMTSDGEGGMTETWATAYANVKCRVDYLSAKETSAKETAKAGSLTPYQSAIISMPYDTIITPVNRVQIGSSVFTVQAVNIGQTHKAAIRVRVELVP